MKNVPVPDRLLNLSMQVKSGCREWSGYKNSIGYGKVFIDGKAVNAHRAAYAAFIGPIPDGMHVCHTCDNRGCINPKHLFIGNASENMRDMYAKNRHRRGSGKHGQDHPNTTLTNDQVLSIRASTKSYKETAEAFGISYHLVYEIQTRRTWKYI